MSEPTVDELKSKRLCFSCIGEHYLSQEIKAKGKRRKCSYCDEVRRTYELGETAERVQVAFEQHYVRTSNQPDDLQCMMLRDQESSYEWERDGEPVTDAIRNAAQIPDDAAVDIQRILQHEHEDFDSAAMGLETEFDGESYYREKSANGRSWQEEWEHFELSLKTEARFFSRKAAAHLSSVFDGIDKITSSDGRPLVIDAGPKTAFHKLYRARVFQSDEKIEQALCRPDLQLGSPPSPLASAGRMNARGISVFYGSNDPKVAIAEVRPPVGSQVAVAQFEIVRKLRLLDLTALSRAQEGGSIFDIDTATRLERAAFLRSLSHRITRPIMPDDEPFEYLPTQAVADFLATESSMQIDGIIYPSVQANSGALNVVLFYKAASVEALDIPEGTEISASTGQWNEDSWEDEYVVFERTPPKTSSEKDDDEKAWPDFSAIEGAPLGWDMEAREISLRIVTDTIKVHRVESVEYKTNEFSVRRHRWEKRDQDF